jgi:hypothetical protein
VLSYDQYNSIKQPSSVFLQGLDSLYRMGEFVVVVLDMPCPTWLYRLDTPVEFSSTCRIWIFFHILVSVLFPIVASDIPVLVPWP